MCVVLSAYAFVSQIVVQPAESVGRRIRKDVALCHHGQITSFEEGTFDATLIDSIYKQQNLTIATTVFALGNYKEKCTSHNATITQAIDDPFVSVEASFDPDDRSDKSKPLTSRIIGENHLQPRERPTIKLSHHF
ncbi:hypothetical protein QQF64_012969 [Cirrhinus molitorella]|uniref:Uncharacterized protein n=1 Tax=Cirrhinus molitorella TaxID=172907 RepID=A0ABR3LPT4_9TELE